MKNRVVSFDKILGDSVLRLEAEFWVAMPSRQIGYIGNDIIEFSQYGTSKELNDEKKGFPILRLNEFDGYFIGQPQKYCDYIDNETYDLLKLKKDDVLICRTNGNPNYVGKAAIVTNNTDYAYASYLFKIRPKVKMINSSTLTIYLNSKYGRNEINKYSMVSNQCNFSPAKFREIFIPKFNLRLQKNVEKIVYKSAQLKECFENSYQFSEKLILKKLNLLNWLHQRKSSFIKNFSDVQSANRLDAEYFQPKYDELIDKIKSYPHGWDTLENLIKLRDKNFSPKDETKYTYIELANINNNGSISDTALEIGKNLPTRARRIVKTGDVIVSSIEGSLNSIALITPQYDNALCSTGFYVMHSDEFNPETLFCLMKSVVGQMQLKKGCSGTILTAINNDELSKIILPRIDNETQNKIKEKISEMYESMQKSKQLLEIAKHGVEKAIEENEDIAMQWIDEQLKLIGVTL